MLKKLFIFFFVFLTMNCFNIMALGEDVSEISNKYFSFTMPDKLKDIYSIDKFNNGIFVFEKISKNNGFGGFAFGFEMFKNPSDYADIVGSKKVGELVGAKGIIYDMVLMRPTEIQFGEGKETRENYSRLYDLAENVEIKGVNGNKYIKNQGMKGEELYPSILKTYNKNLSNEIGYKYYDINSDGIDELFIGNISKGIIYDIYTMVNRKPTHVVSGKDVDKYYICNDAFLCNEYSQSKDKNSLAVFILEQNSTKLYPQITFIYDTSISKKKPWFIKYGNSDRKESVTKKIFKERIKTFKKQKIEFIPIAKFN